MSEETKIPKELNKTNEMIQELATIQKFARQIARKDFFYNLMSTQINEIVKALADFKKAVPELKTDKTAGGRYQYQSLPALLNAISPALAKNGCTCMQPVHSIADKTYVITMILHSSGQYFRSITEIPEQYIMAGKLVNTRENLQAMGGALTYTKRHALKSMLGIDADEDTDGGSNSYAQRSNYGK